MINHHMSVDIETFSDIDIKKAGLYKYAQSPAFDILLIAFAVDDGPVLIVDLTMDAGAEGAGRNTVHWNEFLAWIHDPYTDLQAFNAAFEHYCLNTFFERRGFSTIPLSRWHCTMAHALYCGYSGGLAAVGEAMGLPQDKRKMGIGAALIRKFCVPQKATKAKPVHRVTPEEEPEKWELFKSYCKQDVTTEREIGRRLARWPMPDREQLLWEITTSANEAGVGVDMDLVRGALEMGAAEQAELEAEAKEISRLENPKSVQQLMKWLNEELDTDEETEVKDLRKGTVADMLAAGVDSDKAARMLELRQLMSKTSTKKFDALEAAVCSDDRVRGMMFYYGASRTGRWAGRIVQPQNLPQNHLSALDYARERVKARDTEMVKACWGSVPDTLSQLIRTAFVPTPGKLYAVADYSAIEARVVAWLAGEQWVLDAFNKGKDIYCATASQMFGVPVEKHGVNAELRQRGKVATLALGYGGGESALVAMGALKMGIPEEDLPEIKQKWRRANPHICQLWRDYEDAATDVMNTGAPWSLAHGITMGREIDTATSQDFLTIRLPTGRKLFYAHPFLAPAKNFPERDSLHYYGMEQASKKWAPVDTWGGKLVENCVAWGTLVLTDRGLVPIELIAPWHRIWDGVEFVEHGGLIDKGRQNTIRVDGIELTPEHKILTTKGWVRSGESRGFDWQAVSLPDGIVPCPEQSPEESPVEMPVCMRSGSGSGCEGPETQRSPHHVLRMYEGEADRGTPADARDVEASRLGSVALNETALPGSHAQGLSQLWRAWHHHLHGLAEQLRGILAGHGAHIPAGAGLGSDRQQQGVLTGKLPMDDPENKQPEPENQPGDRHPAGTDDSIRAERTDGDRGDYAAVPTGPRLADRIIVHKTERKELVYDIRNCGPRHRFTVYDPTTQRFRIVSNCTQAIARDCLAETLIRLQQIGLTAVFHVHDEVIVEVDREEQLQDVLEIMARPLDWAPGLPLKGAGFVCTYYQKD